MSESSGTAHAVVRVDYHQFLLQEEELVAAPHPAPTVGNGLVGTVPGYAVIRTGASIGVVTVIIDVRDSPLEVDAAGWDEVVDIDLNAPAGRILVASLGDDPPPLPVLTPAGPGNYRIRVHARGRDINFDAVAYQPDETYLITIWPADPAPEVVHEQTDRCGASFRSSLALGPAVDRPPSSVDQRVRRIPGPVTHDTAVDIAVVEATEPPTPHP